MTRRTRFAPAATCVGVFASAAQAADPAGSAFVWATALPEPGTLALLGLAAICLALFRRRRKSKPPE